MLCDSNNRKRYRLLPINKIGHDKHHLSGVNHIVKFQAAAGGVQRATLPTDAPAKAGAAITENGETADFGDAVQAGSIAAVQAGQ